MVSFPSLSSPRIPALQQSNHFNIEQRLSPTAVKVAALQPQLIIGEANVFSIDSKEQTLLLSPPFCRLLALLVELQEIEPQIAEVRSLNELHAFLQRSQSSKRGFLNDPGTEPWQVQDSPTKLAFGEELQGVLQLMGFWGPSGELTRPIAVDYCAILGAPSMRMEKRLSQTLQALSSHVEVGKCIYLLGSKRPMLQQEILHLNRLLSRLSNAEQERCTHLYGEPETWNETKALAFLWRILAPEELQAKFANRVKIISSERIAQGARRSTTADIVLDLQDSLAFEESLSMFSLAECPYLRMNHLLRWSLVNRSQPKDASDLIETIAKTAFHFTFPAPGPENKISLALAEIAENVKLTLSALDRLEALQSSESTIPNGVYSS